MPVWAIFTTLLIRFQSLSTLCLLAIASSRRTSAGETDSLLSKIVYLLNGLTKQGIYKLLNELLYLYIIAYVICICQAFYRYIQRWVATLLAICGKGGMPKTYPRLIP